MMQEKNKIPRNLIGKFLIFFKILLFLHCMTPKLGALTMLDYFYTTVIHFIQPIVRFHIGKRVSLYQRVASVFSSMSHALVPGL